MRITRGEWRVAWLTLTRVLGGVVVGVVLGAVIDAATPMLPIWLRMSIASLVAISAFMAGAARWGRDVARLAQFGDERRTALATGSLVGATTVIAGLALARLEPVLVARAATAGVGIHVVYTLVFVPAAFLIGATGGVGLGVGAKDPSLGRRLALAAGIGAAAGFLVVDLAMDAMGWRVGGPDAGRRATMLVVTALASTAAATFAGIGIARTLRAAFTERRQLPR